MRITGWSPFIFIVLTSIAPQAAHGAGSIMRHSKTKREGDVRPDGLLELEHTAGEKATRRHGGRYRTDDASSLQSTRRNTKDGLGQVANRPEHPAQSADDPEPFEAASEPDLSAAIKAFIESKGSVTGVAEVGQVEGARKDRLLYLGILSAPDNRDRRDKCRKAFANHVRKGTWPGVLAEFIIGHMAYEGSAQGTLATEEQLRLERSLVSESHEFGDITRIPLPEKYQNLPDKTFLTVRRAVEQGWQWIVKIDDDQSALMDSMLRFAKCTDWNSNVYAGNYFWGQKVYASQTGADGTFAQYFSGPAYMLSYRLAKSVTVTAEIHSAEFLTYGSSSEDVDMGQWVRYIAEQLGEDIDVVTLGISEGQDGAVRQTIPLESIKCPEHPPASIKLTGKSPKAALLSLLFFATSAESKTNSESPSHDQIG